MALDALPQYNGLTISRFQLVEVSLPTERGKKEYRSGVTLDACRSIDGGYSWAIRQSNGFCLDKDGDWEYESMPSSRDDQFYEMCRFPTIEKALEAWALCQKKESV